MYMLYSPKSENVISSWMLYDDDHIMAFNKPPDIAVQGYLYV